MNRIFTSITSKCAICLLLALGAPLSATADITNVKTQNTVEILKEGAHCEDDPNCFNRYHPAIKPVATAKPGDLIKVHTRDALDSNLTIDSEPKDIMACLLYTSPSPRDRG